MNTIKALKTTIMGLYLIGALSACTQTPKAPVKHTASVQRCNIPGHKKLPVAINQAQAELSQRSCHYQFDAMHQQLLHIAEDDPANDNGGKFLQFYKWSVDQGIISSRQGKEYYNRYFKATFGNVLLNDRNVCSMRPQKDALVQNLGRELTYKKTGLQTIMQDRDAYFEAQRMHNELVFLIETTLLACSDA